MKFTKLRSNLLDSNVYVLENGGEAIIVDCGCQVEKVIPFVEGKKVVGILLTHGHYDHCAYVNDYAKKFNAKVYANINIRETMTDKKAIYSEDETTIDDFSHFDFIDGDTTLSLGNFTVQCEYCPGHSRCCECYIIDGDLFAGDVLFEKSFGRIDLIGSNRQDMYSSLCKLEKLDFNHVYSGHGEDSTKQEQLAHFPLFKRFLTR